MVAKSDPDVISNFTNAAAGAIREIEDVAVKHRELLTKRAVKNIKLFLHGQVDILISNLDRLAIESPVPAVGRFSILDDIDAKEQEAEQLPEEPSPRVAPKPVARATPRPQPPLKPGQLPRATEEDLKQERMNQETEAINGMNFMDQK